MYSPYLPILGSFLLSVIALVYDDLYGTSVEGSIQHGNVKYVHPCVHERLLTVYQILLSYLPRLLERREHQRQTISQHHGWDTTAGKWDIEYLPGFR
jgi:hypothetical protein